MVDSKQKQNMTQEEANQAILKAAARLPMPKAPALGIQKAAIAAKIAAQPQTSAAFWRSPRLLIPAMALPLLVLGAFLLLRPSSPETLFFEAKAGTQTSYVLADGSHIDLRANSQITLEPGFGQDHRHLNLKGEAFFRVKKGAAPFEVRVGQTKVTVLGTAFNIKQTDQAVKLHVNEGKVSFSAVLQGEPHNLLLTGGDTTSFDTDTGFQPITHFQSRSGPLWKEHIYQFHQDPLKDIRRELEHDFNVKIHIDASLQQRLINGRIASESLPEIMDLLAALVGGSWFEKGGQFYLEQTQP